LAGAELYDSITNQWTPAASMAHARWIHTLTLLPNGKALIAGGVDQTGTFVATAELYHPATDSWTPAGSLSQPRWLHTMYSLSSDSNTSPLAWCPEFATGRPVMTSSWFV
jgi:hypothetical protein